MVKVLVNGISGRMGQELCKIVKKSKQFEICAGVCKDNNLSEPFPIYNNVNLIKDKVDIIIDFSVPEATMNILEYAKKNCIPIVVATTGLSEAQLIKIDEYSSSIPIFYSSNMSYEINIMKDIVVKLAMKLPKADIEIIETHHRNKIDSPSGTALFLANSINTALNGKMEYKYNRYETKTKRQNNEIGIHSIRGGTEIGKHTVIFFGENESLEITHTANTRSAFAEGALKAGTFLLKQKNGLYNMQNVME